MLHVHCGDSSAAALRAAEAPGEVIVWCDPLCLGPTPADADAAAWRRVRAEFLTRLTGGGAPDPAAWLDRQDAELERWREHEEIVLWFDACMYDHAILIRQLDYFSRQDLGDRRLSMIQVAEHPDVPNFRGLGELAPASLLALLPAREPVTAAQFASGRRAWAAWRSADPRDLEATIAADEGALPGLAAALRRHLEQFPDRARGLCRLEAQALASLAAGATRLAEVWQDVNAAERRPWCGDTMLWALLDDLARAPIPLLHVNGPGPLPRWRCESPLEAWELAITPAGRRVLAGGADHQLLNRIDRWVGGVHLHPDGPAWRWDVANERLVRH